MIGAGSVATGDMQAGAIAASVPTQLFWMRD